MSQKLAVLAKRSPTMKLAIDPQFAAGLIAAAEAVCFACGNAQYAPAALETKGKYQGEMVHRDLDGTARTYCDAAEILALLSKLSQ